MKTKTRREVMNWLEIRFSHVKKSEEFNGVGGGIWLSAEEDVMYGGFKIFDYYSETKRHSLGVLSKWEAKLNERGWYSEWYDAGTIMLWKI